MKTKYLYFNGTYLHTNKELQEIVKKLIDEGKNIDSLIRLLSDVYRNGYLRAFCQQEEYENGQEKKDYKIEFDYNLTGDIRIANHVAGRLKGDDSYAPFYGNFHKYFHFFRVSIKREYEQSITSISSNSEDDHEHIYLLNGFRKTTHDEQKACIVITYSIDIKETLNEQIPIFINGKKEGITIDLSKAKEKQEIHVPIIEALLDPTTDIEVWFGQNGSYGRILLKAPQINVPLQFRGETIIYPMMRILQGANYFYMGIWPFEFNNTQDWEKIVANNWYLNDNYSHRSIDFFLETDVKDSFPEHYQEELFRAIVWNNLPELEEPSEGYWRIGVPSKDEWEKASLGCNDTTLCGSIISKYKIGEDCDLSSKSLKQHMKVRPNALGLYAMFGNFHELALNGTAPYYMGGDLRVREDLKEMDLAPKGSIDRERVSLFCYRFIIHSAEFYDREAELDAVYKELHKNDIDSDPYYDAMVRY